MLAWLLGSKVGRGMALPPATSETHGRHLYSAKGIVTSPANICLVAVEGP